MALVEDLNQDWRSRLMIDCPNQSAATRESIIRWLLGKDLERFERLNPVQLKFVQQAIEYRYRILQRYLGLEPKQAYHNLTARLLRSVLLRSKIRTWMTLNRVREAYAEHNRSSAVVDVLQELIQELLQKDSYIQQQITWIAECTADLKLRNVLLFASTEEYCLRPIRNQPLLFYRFVNYLRRTQRGGLTQVPTNASIRLVSSEVLTDDTENPISLLDSQVIAEYQETQALEEQQALLAAVKQEFSSYLATRLGSVAVQWLQLYLQGRSQDAIARTLNLSVKEVYQLREKVKYHAVCVFTLKQAPELVGYWLENSLQEHSFGLTPQQWQQFWENLTARQRQLIELLKAGQNIEAIAKDLNLKTNQVMGEGRKFYLTAQALRT